MPVKYGFEVPKKTSKTALKVLKKLNKRKVVIFDHDDGPDLQVSAELVKIANAVNLTVIQQVHRLVLFTEKGVTKFKF